MWYLLSVFTSSSRAWSAISIVEDVESFEQEKRRENRRLVEKIKARERAPPSV